MVESSRAKINFIKLTAEDLSSRLELLVSNYERVIFWKSSPRYFEGRATTFSIKGNHTFLTLERTGIPIRVLNERICLNFMLNRIDYFLRGRVVEQGEDNFQIIIELDTECFKSEKRSKERLQTYPLYEAYVYLKFEKENKKNLIFFDKKMQTAKDFFSSIDKFQKHKISLIAKDLHVKNEDEEDLIGFRVEDLSSSGLSFFVNAKEKKMTLDMLSKDFFTLILSFEGEVFTLDDAIIVYEINYINAQFFNTLMYKVGINFELNFSLKDKIEHLAGIAIDSVDYQKKFEEFIKNE